jgi:hypothetical protein
MKKIYTGIVEAEINEYINDKSLINKIKLLMIDTFTSAQSFIKDKNGKESVSMRETRKFMTIYKFLIKDFERKKKISHIYSNKSELQKSINAEEGYTFYLNKDEFLAQKYSIATAIYICFYIRLSESKDKTDFETEMNKLFELNFTEYPK